MIDGPQQMAALGDAPMGVERASWRAHRRPHDVRHRPCRDVRDGAQIPDVGVL